MKHLEPNFDVTPALEEVALPSAVVDRDGRIRWLNRGATELIGERVGEPLVVAIAPEDHHVACTNFEKKLDGETASTSYSLALVTRNGQRLRVNVSSVPFWERGRDHRCFRRRVPGPHGKWRPAALERIARATRAHNPPIRSAGAAGRGPRDTRDLGATRNRRRDRAEPHPRRPHAARCALTPRSRRARVPARSARAESHLSRRALTLTRARESPVRVRVPRATR